MHAVSLLGQLLPLPFLIPHFSAMALSSSELQRRLLTLVVPQEAAEIPLPTLTHVVKRAGIENRLDRALLCFN